MCLITFAYKAHKKYNLIVAANRDEFYERPTAPAQYWDDAPHILAGRDLHRMGTWMGVTKQGKFAALTNYRNGEEKQATKRSRGELVKDFLMDDETPVSYLEKVQMRKGQYPGFNLLVGDHNGLYYYSNINDTIYTLEPGIYGLSNHFINSPWPKVIKGKKGLERCLKCSNSVMEDCLFSSLQRAESPPDEQLPQTGIPLEWERKLSPIFIKTDTYGTRASTLLFITDKQIQFTERTFEGEKYKDRNFTFYINET
ncbi:NRDE family protein [Salirhabdus salicampi]|uniref:NRDE family protein n=1 Tax=Salirhabdus salicampi TaxID=476102 RepID=UPI0020C3D510|nr:NRDE family protein [Salirhabdus salicampi]MCP8616259.1 NRDE family protein [Salirhabdus salicampi]